MKLVEIQDQALALDDSDRASLAAMLLGSLPAPCMDISDEEVAQRAKDLETGAAREISFEELVQGLKRELGK